ncbi:hypothetical protein ACH41H_37245 [Streptomyces sp. NPDC020800]
MLVGLTASVLLAIVGMPALAVMSAGGGTLAFTFGAGMTAVSYIRKQNN